jgi:hypothetical protein
VHSNPIPVAQSNLGLLSRPPNALLIRLEAGHGGADARNASPMARRMLPSGPEGGSTAFDESGAAAASLASPVQTSSSDHLHGDKCPVSRRSCSAHFGPLVLSTHPARHLSAAQHYSANVESLRAKESGPDAAISPSRPSGTRVCRDRRRFRCQADRPVRLTDSYKFFSQSNRQESPNKSPSHAACCPLW